jgi:Tfp pilus assembly protein PilF
VRVAVIVLNAAVVVGAGRDGHAANAERRIARGGDGLARLLGILHEGNEQRARAHVERALDDDRSFQGTRKTGSAVPPRMACNCGSSVVMSLGACSPSMTIQSKPAPARISAAWGWPGCTRGRPAARSG